MWRVQYHVSDKECTMHERSRRAENTRLLLHEGRSIATVPCLSRGRRRDCFASLSTATERRTNLSDLPFRPVNGLRLWVTFVRTPFRESAWGIWPGGFLGGTLPRARDGIAVSRAISRHLISANKNVDALSLGNTFLRRRRQPQSFVPRFSHGLFWREPLIVCCSKAFRTESAFAFVVAKTIAAFAWRTFQGGLRRKGRAARGRRPVSSGHSGEPRTRRSRAKGEDASFAACALCRHCAVC